MQKYFEIIFVNEIVRTFYVIYPSKNASLKMGHNRWLKHVEGYAVYNTIKLHICLCPF